MKIWLQGWQEDISENQGFCRCKHLRQGLLHFPRKARGPKLALVRYETICFQAKVWLAWCVTLNQAWQMDCQNNEELNSTPWLVVLVFDKSGMCLVIMLNWYTLNFLVCIPMIYSKQMSRSGNQPLNNIRGSHIKLSSLAFKMLLINKDTHTWIQECIHSFVWPKRFFINL